MTPTSLPPRPPDGTYVYRATYAGSEIAKDTIVVTSSGTNVVVRDAGTISVQSVSALATTTFDAATLSETGYTADFTLPAGTQHTDVSFAPGDVTVRVPGQIVSIKADPSAPLEFTGDNLAGSFFMLLAALHAHAAARFTLAALEGGVALVSQVQPLANATRPPGVPSADIAADVTFGQAAQTFWYDPATYVVDAVEIPSQGAEIRLVSRSAGVTAATPEPLATPVPTPLPHFSSTNVSFVSAGGIRLAGTVTVPHGTRHRFPAVILVHGSGPENRDESIGPNLVFLQLSNALSNAGYVVVRYDKRGIGRSGGNAATSTRNDLLADVRAALAFAKTLPSVDPHRIFLLGHSEGGELVPSVAAGNPAVAGIVLMAPPALPLAQIVMEQTLESVTAAQRAAARRDELAALEKIRNGTTTGPGMPWLRSSLDVDPIVAIARVRAPILILQGADDVQVLPRDLPRLVNAARRGNRDVTVRIFPGDNHLFMRVTPGEPLTPQAALHQYLTVPGYVDPAVLATLIRWLNVHAHSCCP